MAVSDSNKYVTKRYAAKLNRLEAEAELKDDFDYEEPARSETERLNEGFLLLDLYENLEAV